MSTLTMTRGTATGRVLIALRRRHDTLCEYLVDEALQPKHGKEFIRNIAKQLDELELQLKDPVAVADRVIAALEGA